MLDECMDSGVCWMSACGSGHSSVNRMQAKVAVVIGGCGFLGRHLVEGLVARGYRVRVFDLSTSFSCEGVQFFTGNLCQKEVRAGPPGRCIQPLIAYTEHSGPAASAARS